MATEEEEGSSCHEHVVVEEDIDNLNELYMVHLADDENDTNYIEHESSASALKGKKKISEAWDYFKLVTVNGVPKARCIHCKTLFVAGPGIGTSHLLKHLRNACPRRHLMLPDGGQSKANHKHKTDEIVEDKFDQEISRKELVNMIVMHEYPLSMVDHNGLRRFVHSLNPKFKMISRNTLKVDIMKRFEAGKVALKDLLMHNSSRIAITTDMWTASNQKRGYMVITSHFIDDYWVLHNRTISAFSMGGRVISPHRSRLHAKTVEALMCLQSWMIDDFKGTKERGSYGTIIDDVDMLGDAQIADILDMDLDAYVGMEESMDN